MHYTRPKINFNINVKIIYLALRQTFDNQKSLIKLKASMHYQYMTFAITDLP